MKDKKTHASKKYVMASVTGAIIAFAIMYWRGIFEAQTAQEVMMTICDGFFVVGLLYAGFGLLLYAAHEGTLDIITYGLRSVLYLFAPFKNRDEGGYYEYKMKKKERRKEVPFFILWIGIVFILISVVFLVLYESI